MGVTGGETPVVSVVYIQHPRGVRVGQQSDSLTVNLLYFSEVSRV